MWFRRWGFTYGSSRAVAHSRQHRGYETQQLKNRAFIKARNKKMKIENKKGACVNVRLNYMYNIFAGDVQFYSLYLDTLVIITQQFRGKSRLS